MIDNILFIAIILLYLIAVKYGALWLSKLGAKDPIFTFVSLSVAIPVTVMCLIGIFNTPGVLHKFGAVGLLSIPMLACWLLVILGFNTKKNW